MTSKGKNEVRSTRSFNWSVSTTSPRRAPTSELQAARDGSSGCVVTPSPKPGVRAGLTPANAKS